MCIDLDCVVAREFPLADPAERALDHQGMSGGAVPGPSGRREHDDPLLLNPTKPVVGKRQAVRFECPHQRHRNRLVQAHFRRNPHVIAGSVRLHMFHYDGARIVSRGPASTPVHQQFHQFIGLKPVDIYRRNPELSKLMRLRHFL